jgi:putative restriction endonuclease
MSAWSFLTVPTRQHGGNLGYDDRTSDHYSFDSTVANCGKVRTGDLAVVRDSFRLLGIGWIDEIKEQSTSKTRLRCPKCETTGFKTRTTISPRYRCSNKHEFEAPKIEVIPVRKYIATYARTWTPAPRPVDSGALESMTIGRAQQHSIRRIDFTNLVAHFASHFGADWWHSFEAQRSAIYGTTAMREDGR